MRKEQINHIRIYKNELRLKYKTLRRKMPNKNVLDSAIFNKIVNTKAFMECDAVLTYVSTNIEVDTQRLISYSLENNKLVAAPKCIDGTRDMKFYTINSLNDLETATFSVLEPVVDKCEEFAQYELKCLCIVPGLVFDTDGYRLGYGKGYYDRYLNQHPNLIKMGLCYCQCTVNKLFHGKYDVPVDYLVTEKYLRKIGK